MKSSFTILAIFLALMAFSQTNYSGSYGYSLKPSGTPPAGEKVTGPEGSLVLLKMEGNLYRFWLDVKKGWPSNDMDATDGTLRFVNDTASFDNTFVNAKKSCVLHFKIDKNVVHITSSSSSGDCGFGDNVVADGDYAKWKVQPKLNNTWLNDQYSQSLKAMVAENKTILYKDENALYPTGNTLSKGDVILSIAETEKTIYTERFTTSGKFIYGWVKKTAVKMMEPD